MEDKIFSTITHFGISARAFVIIIGIVALFVVYRNILEIQKLHLEISRLNKINNQVNNPSNPEIN